MKLRPRPETLTVTPAVHGGLDDPELERLGIPSADVLDFSSNTNPEGPSPAVPAALARVPLHRFPDRDALALRTSLARLLELPVECLLAGNGASELLALVAQAYLRRGDRVLILAPTYAEYARAAELAGARVCCWHSRLEQGFAVVGSEVEQLLRQLRPRLVFVCNPNNPTGTVIALETLAGWIAAAPQTLLVVDESYHAFVEGLHSAMELKADNVVVVRSLTKDHALAGLRLGYAAGSPDVLRPLAHLQPPWSVNALAQAAGVAAVEDRTHLEQSLRRLRQAREELMAGLDRLGLEVLPSAAHYFLVRVGDGASLRRALLARGILVRDGASWGLPEWVRISTRRPHENARLLAALEEERA
jgi:L-threonine-O-3-phosphate decarboxylase